MFYWYSSVFFLIYFIFFFVLSVPVERKLTFLYLCNEIMQTSRRYTQDFINSFTTVLPNAVKTIMR